LTIRTGILLFTISTVVLCVVGDAARSRATEPIAPSPGPPSAAVPDAAMELSYRPLIARRVISTPPGAQILRRGAVLGTTPIELELSQSDRPAWFTVRLAGHVEQTIAIVPDEPDTTYIALGRAPPPPDTEPASDRPSPLERRTPPTPPAQQPRGRVRAPTAQRRIASSEMP